MSNKRNRPFNFFRPGLWGGLVCVGFSVGPLVVFGALQRLGYVDPGNNGLGLGLWFTISAPFALVALGLGVAYDAKYPM
jgi:hypothetical protein